MTRRHGEALDRLAARHRLPGAGYMGGEPLLRPDLIHRITYYAAKKDFWIYLPTNARLLRIDVIDKLADAGLATFNIAVDAVDLKPGLPKALVPIRKQFDYLVRKQYDYGYSVFLNINICRNNLDDVRQLTEIAHDCGIATDYHINESPLLEQDEHFKHCGRKRHLHHQRRLAGSRGNHPVAHRKTGFRLQDGELECAALADGRIS